MLKHVEYESPSFSFNEIKKVFDTSFYKKYDSKVRPKIIANDLAGLVLEAGDRKLEDRINPWYVAITQEGRIVNLTTKEEVTLNFGNNTELARNETQGTIDFYYDKAKNAKIGDKIFWISPSDGNSPYKESRINVAKVRELFGMKILECYGIPSNLSPHEILKIANKLLIKAGQNPIFNPDDLREIAIKVDDVKDLSLDSNAWEEILNGTPRKIKRKAFKSALPIAKKMSKKLEFATCERDFIHIGAIGERYMAQNGWIINDYGCPGFLNSQIERMGQRNGLIIDAIGNFRKININESTARERHPDWNWHKGDCVRCKATEVYVADCSVCEKCQDEYDKNETVFNYYMAA